MRVEKEKYLSGKPLFKAVILTADGFEDMELFFPYFRLLEENATADVAAPSKAVITGKRGYTLDNVDKTFEEVDPKDYDLLIVPGGSATGAPAIVRRSGKAQEIARAFMTEDRPVAALCHGVYLLISADVVRGRTMTSYWGDGVPDEVRGAGATWVDAEVVVDRNLVTSRYQVDLPAFLRETLKMMRRVLEAGVGPPSSNLRLP